MGLRLTPTGGSDEASAALAKAEAAQAAADAAMDRANNARGMVLADRERNALSLDELRAAAAQLPTTQQAAAEAHLALQQQIDTIREMVNTDATANDATQAQLDALVQQVAAIELTPGPPGKDGKDGAPGSNGSPGASAYDLARANGYGGTLTQWLASIKGADGAAGQAGQPGAKGDAGTPADMTRVAALEAAVATLSAKAIIKQEKRVTTTQLIALGGTTDMTVTWDTPFPDTNYVVIPLLDASTGISNVNPPALKSKTATGCVVTVRANVAVAAGLAVNVVGLKFG